MLVGERACQRIDHDGMPAVAFAPDRNLLAERSSIAAAGSQCHHVVACRRDGDEHVVDDPKQVPMVAMYDSVRCPLVDVEVPPCEAAPCETVPCEAVLCETAPCEAAQYGVAEYGLAQYGLACGGATPVAETQTGSVPVAQHYAAHADQSDQLGGGCN